MLIKHRGSGGDFFGASMPNQYLVLAIMIDENECPLILPAFDLSTFIKERSQIMAENQRNAETNDKVRGRSGGGANEIEGRLRIIRRPYRGHFSRTL
jgi:hypothetical protein